MKIMGKSWENDETWRFNAGDIKELMEGSTGRSPFSRGFWENQGTVAGDTGFFRTDDFRMSKRGPMAQEFRNLNRELLDTSRNA